LQAGKSRAITIAIAALFKIPIQVWLKRKGKKEIRELTIRMLPEEKNSRY
jgi:hypothetical protein